MSILETLDIVLKTFFWLAIVVVLGFIASSMFFAVLEGLKTFREELRKFKDSSGTQNQISHNPNNNSDGYGNQTVED